MSGFWDEMGYAAKVKGTEEQAGATPQADSPEGQTAPGGAYFSLRGIRDEAKVLEFRLKQGSPQAIKYSFFRSAEGPSAEGPDEGCLKLYFVPGDQVTLYGKGLAEIKDLIYREKMVWIQELSRQEAHALPAAVTRIDVDIKHKGEPARQEEGEQRPAPRRIVARG